MAVQPGTSLAVQMLASTPLLVTILDGVLAAAIIALLAIQLGAATSLGLLLGAVAFIVTVGGFAWYAGRDIQRIIDAHQPLFPGPTDPTS
jgi:hypothetical protein